MDACYTSNNPEPLHMQIICIKNTLNSLVNYLSSVLSSRDDCLLVYEATNMICYSLFNPTYMHMRAYTGLN